MIARFESFPSSRPPRQARNPKTGVPVTFAGKRVPHFKEGKGPIR
ncbi:MAG: HU family DNA-binding protein [Steroidobacteraceae bacterium]|nr:HU family DNA-binding protein [Steroidobacteraceae bacterium]